MGYKISPPALRSRFFLSPRPDAKLLDLTSKGVIKVWRGICPFLKIVRRNVGKVLSKLTTRQKKQIFVALFFIVWGVVCVAGGVYWIGRVGGEEVWEEVLADLFFN